MQGCAITVAMVAHRGFARACAHCAMAMLHTDNKPRITFVCVCLYDGYNTIAQCSKEQQLNHSEAAAAACAALRSDTRTDAEHS
jgi:hypothetical protein